MKSGENFRGPKPHSCHGCPARWSGALTAHCAACHLTFSGISGFDWHQTTTGCKSRGQLTAKGYREVRPGVLGVPTPNAGGGNG